MMRKITASSICTVLLCALLGAAGEIQDFITALNTNWIARNYTGIAETIEDRLAQRTNDLSALVVKADYYTSIELDTTRVQNVVGQIQQFYGSLNWTNDEEAKVLLEEMLYSATHRAEQEAHGYIFGFTSNQIEQLRNEMPTNYPPTVLVPRWATVQYGSAE